MAKSGGLEIPPEYEALLNRLLRRISPRTAGAMGINPHLLSKARKRSISNRSLLPECSQRWGTLSEAEKDDWAAAGDEVNMSGWALFVQDTSYRINVGLPGVAVPSTLHQYKCGRIDIPDTEDHAIIKQEHPRRYWVRRKVEGHKGLYEDEPVDEVLSLPLEIGCSYRSDLTNISGDGYAKIYALVEHHYQGQKLYADVGFEMQLQAGWTRNTATLSQTLGIARSYTLFIELFGVHGWLEFDNLLAFHTGNNFARDFACNDINQPPLDAYYVVSPSWEADDVPLAVTWGSVYHDD